MARKTKPVAATDPAAAREKALAWWENARRLVDQLYNQTADLKDAMRKDGPLDGFVCDHTVRQLTASLGDAVSVLMFAPREAERRDTFPGPV